MHRTQQPAGSLAKSCFIGSKGNCSPGMCPIKHKVRSKHQDAAIIYDKKRIFKGKLYSCEPPIPLLSQDRWVFIRIRFVHHAINSFNNVILRWLAEIVAVGAIRRTVFFCGKCPRLGIQ